MHLLDSLTQRSAILYIDSSYSRSRSEELPATMSPTASGGGTGSTSPQDDDVIVLSESAVNIWAQGKPTSHLPMWIGDLRREPNTRQIDFKGRSFVLYLVRGADSTKGF